MISSIFHKKKQINIKTLPITKPTIKKPIAKRAGKNPLESENAKAAKGGKVMQIKCSYRQFQ